MATEQAQPIRLAFSSLACPDWTVEQIAAATARYGFDGIEWRIADGEPITAATSPAIIRRVVAATRSYGLSVVALDTSCRLVQPDVTARIATLDEARFMIDLATELGAPMVRLFGGPLSPDETVEAALPAAAALLRAIADLAAAQGVRALLETHDPAWSLSANALALLHGAGASSAGIVYDVLHPYRMGEAIDTTLANLGPHIRLVHLKDGRRASDNSVNWPLCAIGAGDVPLSTILAGLRAIGYDGWYTFEWEKRWHRELAEPEIALPQGAAALRALAGT